MNRFLFFFLAFTAITSAFSQTPDCKKYTVTHTNSICNPATWQPFILRSGNTRFVTDQMEFRENNDNTATLKGVGRDETWQPVVFNLSFMNKTTVAPNGFPQLINCLQNTSINTANWSYYTQVSGTIIYKQDTCVISGFSTTPLGLQIGVGANTQNDADLGAYTTLKGQFKQQTTPISYEMAFKLANPQTVVCPNTNCETDNIAPEWANCPTDIFRATSDSLYTVSWIAPTATDNCSTPSVSSDFKPNDIFVTGKNTLVTYTATDTKGNKSTCSFTIHISKVDTVKTSNPYCISKSNMPWEEWIGGVKLSDLDNPSDKTREIAGVPFVAGYSDFRDKMVTMRQSKTYTLALRPGLSYATSPADLYWRVWIDFNNDKDFDDAGELVFEKKNGNQPILDSIRIPLTAQAGKTMMRISAKNGAFAMPCDTFERGEVEDYTVNILMVDPCEVDTKAPVFSNCPADINISTTGTSAVVQWTAPTVKDDCSSVTLTSNFVIGAIFPVGTTKVIYTAKDAQANQSVCSFTITVTANNTINKGDIELSLSSNPTTYKKLSNINLKLTAKNKGTTGFKDIKIQFKHPVGAANGGAVTPSVGNWTEYCPNASLCFEWTIPQLDSAVTATLDVPLFIQDIDTPLVATARLLSSMPNDTVTANNTVTLTIKSSTTAINSVDIFQPTAQNPIIIQALLPTITEGALTLKVESLLDKKIDFSIFNAQGISVKIEHQPVSIGNNILNIDVSQLPNGIYWITPWVTGKFNKPLKFVKI